MLTGCNHYNHTVVTTNARASSDWGNLRVYASETVPFLYEELGLVSESESSFWHLPNETALLSRFQRRVNEMGADAIIGFRYSTFVSWRCVAEASGIAVRIQRP